MKNIRIIGVGHKPAETCVTNDMLSEIVDTNDEWITTRTGIKTRYFSENKNTSELGYEAALNAIKDAGIDKSEIEAIIVATMTPDNAMPSTACLIQEMLGLNDQKIMAFDMNAACNGFISALQVGSSLLGRFKTVLVVGAETNSKILDFADRSTCILFGDGAGAAVLRYEECEKETFMYSNSMGDNKNVLTCKNNGLTPLMTSNRAVNNYMTMQGNDVFRFAIRVMEEAIVEVLKESNLTIDDIDCIIPHQANIRIIKHVARSMNLPMEKVFVNLDKYGNTSSASIGIALSEAKAQGVIKENDKVILVGFGGGFTYSSYLYQF